MQGKGKTGSLKLGVFVILMAILSASVYAVPSIITPPNKFTFNLTEDLRFTYNITATDDEGYYPINFTDTAKDEGVGFYCFSKEAYNGSVSLINFTPTNEYVGYYTVTINARNTQDNQGSVIVYFNVSNSNDAPYIISTTPTPGFIFEENTTLAMSVEVGDDDFIHGDEMNFTWYLDGVISDKLNFSKMNISYSEANYTPDFFDYSVNAHNVTVLVNDTGGGHVNYTWNLFVTNLNRPPVFNQSIENITWQEDNNLTDNITLTDHFYDLDAFMTANGLCEPDTGTCLDFDYDVVAGNPADIAIDINDTTGNVSFYPADNWFGTMNVTFSVSDGYETVESDTVVLTVINIDDPPVITPIENQSNWAHTNFTYQVMAYEPDFQPMTYSIGSPTLRDNISIDSAGFIEFFSNQSFVGNHTVNVTVSDGLLESYEVFNLEVLNNSLPEFITTWNQSVVQFSTLEFNLTGYDEDGDAMTIWTNFSLLVEGESNTTSQNFSVTPTAQSLVGNHSVRAFINDSHNASSYMDFWLNIIDLAKTPEIDPLSVSNDQIKNNTPFTLDVYAFDEDGNIVSFSDNTSLFNINTIDTGSISEDAMGRISFTPQDTGYHEINISVGDSTGRSNGTTLILNITVNSPPYFIDLQNITCDENDLCEFQVDAGDPDWQDSIIYSDNASKFDIDTNTGLISFTSSSPEVYNANISISDGTANITQTIMINITEINDAPIFTEDVENLPVWDTVTEDAETNFQLTADDEENDTIYLNVEFFNFTNLAGQTYTEGIDLFNFTGITTNANNSVTGDLIFTPATNEVGEYWVNISATDEFNASTSIVFNFSVRNRNNLPEINWTLDYDFGGIQLSGDENNNSNSLNCTENTSIVISTETFDADYDTLDFRWYRKERDGTSSLVLEGQDNINYTIPFNASPYQFLVLSVEDARNTTNITWRLNATNVNRPVYFGEKRYSFNSEKGYYGNTEAYENESLRLQIESSPDYYEDGYFTSDTIDFETTSFDIPRIDYRSMSYENDDNSSDYSISLSTATSQSYAEPLSFWEPYNQSEIEDSNYRYLAFRAEINSTNTSVSPDIKDFVIGYDIQDLEVVAGTEYSAWLDLDKFFSDPDYDDELSYGFRFISGSSLVSATLAQEHYVAMAFNQPGTVEMVFNATDGESYEESNLVTIEILEGSGEDEEQENEDSDSSSDSSSSTNTIIQTETVYKYKTKEEPVALDIIHPEDVTIYKDEIVKIPITLKNNEKFDLRGIEISAETDREDVEIDIDKTHLDLLGKNTDSTLFLTMNVSKVYDSYGVYVNVNVTEPEYSDSAKIMVSSLKRAQEDENEETMKLSFVSDLLSKNEECAELSEYIERARAHLDEGQLEEGKEILDDFIRDCKILIKKNQKDEVITGNIIDKTITKIRTNNNFFMLAVSIGVIFLITVLVTIITVYRKI